MAASNDKRNSQQKLPLSTEGLFHLSDGITLTQGRNNYISRKEQLYLCGFPQLQ